MQLLASLLPAGLHDNSCIARDSTVCCYVPLKATNYYAHCPPAGLRQNRDKMPGQCPSYFHGIPLLKVFHACLEHSPSNCYMLASGPVAQSGTVREHPTNSPAPYSAFSDTNPIREAGRGALRHSLVRVEVWVPYLPLFPRDAG